MKTIKYIAFSLVLLSLWNCEGFLDEVSQDQLVPKKTDHYAALMLKEFNVEYPIFRTVDYMTDNLTEMPERLTENKIGVKTTYTWQREIGLDENGDQLRSINNAWEQTYEDVAIVNYVIALIDDAIGEEEEKVQIKGEAYFIRALSYFNLLNLYGVPYNKETANEDLGVPIRTSIGIEQYYYRNTVEECYAQIEEDIDEAIRLLEQSKLEKTVWHPTVDACKLLKSRVLLYQEKYDEVIAITEPLLEDNYLPRMYKEAVFVTETNPEILYSFFTLNSLFGSVNTLSYKVDPELINLFDAEDNRKSVFFTEVQMEDGKVYQTSKYLSNTYTTLGFGNFRLAEAYLNRAEAYAMKGETALAINDLKVIHNSRYSDPSVVVYPNQKEELIDFIFTERRKELSFEDHHRWFDLRRMKNRPEIKHTFTIISSNGIKGGTETYTLLSDDANYTLPIPLRERENNPLIRNNIRFEKLPETESEIVIP